MGFFSKLFGGGGESRGSSVAAAIPPDDLDAYFLAHHEIDQAERAGDAQLKAAYRKFGLRDEEHWEEVQSAFADRHRRNPDFVMAPTRLQMRIQIEDAKAKGYQMPEGLLEPIEGIAIDRYALINAYLDAARAQGPDAAGQVLRQHGVDSVAFQRIDAGWKARLSGTSDPTAASILQNYYHTVYSQAVLFVEKGGAW